MPMAETGTEGTAGRTPLTADRIRAVRCGHALLLRIAHRLIPLRPQRRRS